MPWFFRRGRAHKHLVTLWKGLVEKVVLKIAPESLTEFQ